MRIAPIALAALISAPSVLYASVSINAQPLCYMIDGSGHMRDLTAMCGKSGSGGQPENSGSSQALTGDTGDARFIQVGESTDGTPILYDRKSLTPKTFALQTESRNGRVLLKFNFEYACSEQRVFESNITVYEDGQKPRNVKGRDELNFVKGSPASKGLQLACKQSMSPGY